MKGQLRLKMKRYCYVGVLLVSVALSLCVIASGVRMLLEEDLSTVFGMGTLLIGVEVIISSLVTLYVSARTDEYPDREKVSGHGIM